MNVFPRDVSKSDKPVNGFTGQDDTPGNNNKCAANNVLSSNDKLSVFLHQETEILPQKLQLETRLKQFASNNCFRKY